MTWEYPFYSNIDLFVKKRIQQSDSERQRKTAIEILKRLKNQPGLILADEVGMGKTFVALAVAISVSINDEQKRPVVVMIPPSLKDKWPTDFNVFKKECMPQDVADSLKCAVATNTIDFLKLLDDDPSSRNSIIFLTHGALYRGLNDAFVKLAFIQKALYRRKNTNDIYKALSKYVGKLLRIDFIRKERNSIFIELLNREPQKWQNFLIRKKLVNDDFDDPVPHQVIDLLKNIPNSMFNSLYDKICHFLPRRKAKYLKDNISIARDEINSELQHLWGICIKKINTSLPLLIFDEAHHLKNAHTRAAGLFATSDSQGDAESVQNGALAGVFERMIFLTATPFQLGHYELCNILERFYGIKWKNGNIFNFTLTNYIEEIKNLRKILDKYQDSASRFDKAWGKLSEADFEIEELETADWWINISIDNSRVMNDNLSNVLNRYSEAKRNMIEAENVLRKYVIRHLKNKKLHGDYKNVDRRANINGEGIINDDFSAKNGLQISDDAVLPFLLSARLSSLNPESRPVFAEGLSSSYEAFLETRNRKKILDDDDEISVLKTNDSNSEWYINEIFSCIKGSFDNQGTNHTKINATVDKAIDLWLKGEKVLIFCHYIETGRALRNYISKKIKSIINEKVSISLGCSHSEVENELDKIGQRFESDKYILRQEFDKKLEDIVSVFDELKNHKETIKDIIRRYFKTPSFLARFYPLEMEYDNPELLEKAFSSEDDSGLTFNKLIIEFLDFLNNRCVESERLKYLEALMRIQPGGIRAVDLKSSYFPEEIANADPETLVPNVRLANGETKSDTRQKLMLTFNTPFYPDILIASSVMAEGVDLQLNCRYVIHHDLCWNPSTLEQRTGRIDRIGAKTEKCGKSINIYFPFISNTQDEKMYKVVMDRERWFNILMGEEYTEDYLTTEKMATRIPLPDDFINSLKFDLSVS